MESDRQFSRYVSDALDCLGKSQNMIKFRVDTFTEEERHLNILSVGYLENIIAGSKGEGSTALYESDRDVMCVTENVICADNTGTFTHINDLIVFESDRRNTSPGYLLLRLERFESMGCQEMIIESLFEDAYGQIFLSNDFSCNYRKSVLIDSNIQTFLDKTGPSHPALGFGGYFNQDFVHALRYSCHDIIKSFITRPRDYDWPTRDQLREVATLEGHVVPVGSKGSSTAFIEWRICYTKTERFLMRSLNDTHTKLYILLKMVAKTYIKLVSKEITSYVLKNVVLWLKERSNLKELLVDRLIQALVFLRKCITNNNLPSYIIPERNLFSEKLDLVQRNKMVVLLTDLICDGGRLVMGCERLRCTMIVLYKEPAIADQYRLKRNIIEKLTLVNQLSTKQRVVSGTIEQLVQTFSNPAFKILIEILIPDKMSLMEQGHDAVSLVCIVMERLSQWLS